MTTRALAFRTPRPHRRPNLTPMIDVVFLLLVFFMLSSRFGADQGLVLALPTGAASTAYDGPPRLVDVTPGGPHLNGVAITADALPAALGALMASPGDTVVLRAQGGADLSALVAVMEALTAVGLTRLVLVQ